MTITSHVTLLRRMARMEVAVSTQNPLTTARAVRILLPQVAQDTLGLSLSVSSIAESEAELDDMLASLEDGLMLVRLERGTHAAGLLALDAELFGAAVETRTTGKLRGKSAAPRTPTSVDRVLCDGMIKGLLERFPDAVRQTKWDGWVDDVLAGTMFKDARTAGLILQDVRYRIVQMSIDLDGTDRQGNLVLVLPLPRPAPKPEVPTAPQPDWSTALGEIINDVPATLTAELHRFSLPLAQMQRLQVGDVVPLQGCSVSSVRLLDATKRSVATAKLGQSGGMRAIRLETPPAPQMDEIHPSATPALAAEVEDSSGETAAIAAQPFGLGDGPTDTQDAFPLD